MVTISTRIKPRRAGLGQRKRADRRSESESEAGGNPAVLTTSDYSGGRSGEMGRRRDCAGKLVCVISLSYSVGCATADAARPGIFSFLVGRATVLGTWLEP